MKLGAWIACRIAEGTALHVTPAPVGVTLRLVGPTHFHERAVHVNLLDDEPRLVAFLDGEMREGLRRAEAAYGRSDA